MNKPIRSGLFLAYILAGFAFMLDQLSKAMIEWWFPGQGHSITIIPQWNLVRLTFVKNRGAAWGILEGYQLLFVVMALIVSCVCVWVIYRYRDVPLQLFVALILGGGLGNMMDRIFMSSGVVDFLDIGIGPYRWPTFNLADCFLIIGMIGVAWKVLFDDELEEQDSSGKEEEEHAVD